MEVEIWSGRHVINVGDFKLKIEEHFAAKSVTIEFYENESGVHFIKVDNGDSTFQLYERWSKPSYIDLANDLFRGSDEPQITGLSISEATTITWISKERDDAVAEICNRHSISTEDFWESLTGEVADDDPSKAASDEYHEWLFDHEPISLVHEGDLGSRGSSKSD